MPGVDEPAATAARIPADATTLASCGAGCPRLLASDVVTFCWKIAPSAATPVATPPIRNVLLIPDAIPLRAGATTPSAILAIIGVVAPARSGMASGINNTFRIGGVATGVAALGAIFQQKVTTSLASNLGHPAPQLAKVVASAGI